MHVLYAQFDCLHVIIFVFCFSDGAGVVGRGGGVSVAGPGRDGIFQAILQEQGRHWAHALAHGRGNSG